MGAGNAYAKITHSGDIIRLYPITKAFAKL
jgi:hypothetical protein